MNLWKFTALALLLVLFVVVGGSAVRNASAERQPHMVKALVALKNAKEQLDAATLDKGGHRVKALELTAAAIEQVEKGIAFDNAK
jgi:hypothetical protein